ncbi:MAG: DNA repair protein RadC [Clostridia bacterium]|nr:DNA repair protein RadC [Clostridia bacterium]
MGVHDGHRKRLTARFLRQGLEGFAPHEVLELLLFYSIPRQDTNELAHRLIERFGSLSGVLEAPYERLLEVKGVGENTAALLKLMPELTRVYYASRQEGAYVRSNQDAQALLMPRFLGRNEEMVFALLLDAKGKCLALEAIHQGSVNASEVSVRKIAALAISANAAGVILAHNHPGGVSTPSREDVLTTQHIQSTLAAMEIQLVDHLVFADRDFTSMRQSGLLR